ncbi:MAG TPA: hypothetical protein EYN07_01380 [Flavobacteriaceae bacterium]|nr:hypothetical protein [Flavobacteriaceae bacterium]HIN97870.1 hypothetical protein [Flavobacteriaceae bacterium]
MKKILLAALFSLFIFSKVHAQVGIGTITPDASAVLDIEATDKGILIPQVSLADVSDTMLDGVNTAATGLLIYNTNVATVGGTGAGYYYFNGTVWERLSTSSSAGDHDFYEEGSTNAPDDINDDQFTMGNVAIGKSTADFPLDIESDVAQGGVNVVLSGTDNAIRRGTFNNISNSGSGSHQGVLNALSGSGSGSQVGTYNNITNTGNGQHTAVLNQLSGNGTGLHRGINTVLLGSGSGNQFGVSTSINNSGTGVHTAINNFLGGTNTGEKTGVVNQFGALSNGSKTGVYSLFEGNNANDRMGSRNRFLGSGSGNHYGLVNEMINSGNGLHYGTYSTLSGTGSGTHFGNWTRLEGAGTGIQIGNRVAIANTGNNTHYGEFIRLEGSGTGTHNGTEIQLSGSGSGAQLGTINVIDNSGNGLHYGSYNVLRGTGSGTHYGNWARLEGAGTGNQTATYNAITNTNDGDHTGVDNQLSGNGAGIHLGVNNRFTGTGSGTQYGLKNYFLNNATSNAQYGLFSEFYSSGNGTHMGVFSAVNGNGSGSKYGVYNLLGGNGSGTKYGTFTQLGGNGSGDMYGERLLITNSGNGTQYGNYTSINGAGTGIKYGSYNSIDSNAGGFHYGVYSEVLKAGSYAGYFLGNLAVGTVVGDTYTFPASRGTANQIMQTDGAGNMSWIDAPSPSYWSRTGTIVNLANAGDDIAFVSDQTSITFPATSGTPPAMFYMFDSGISNANRMVFAHSTGFSNFGLQYNDADDSFRFLGAGTSVVEIDLTGTTVMSVVGNINVNGDIITDTTTYPDYVFEKYFDAYSEINPEYQFLPLPEAKEFIQNNGHLPGVKSFKEVKENDMNINLSEVAVTNLEKIEELFIYTIEAHEQIENQKTEIAQLKKELAEIKSLFKNKE